MSCNRSRRPGQDGYHEQSAPTRIFRAPVPQPFIRASAPFPYPSPCVQVRVLHDRNASVANVSLARRTAAQCDPPEYEYKASGAAKREPKDVSDDGIGELLALARAFEDLSRQLQREAGRRVRKSVKAENEKQERRAAKRAKRAKAAAPPVHRTLAEWEEIQRGRQQAANAVMAGNLGLTPEHAGDDAGFSLATVAAVPRPTADGRTAVMLADEIAAHKGRHEKTYVSCPVHGYREALSVRGLTGSERVCADCI
jgi:hypothetical protein